MVDELSLKEPKTKLLIKMLGGFGLERALLVSDDLSENLYLASRNLHKVDAVDVEGVNPVSLIGADKVVITVPALKKFEEMLG